MTQPKLILISHHLCPYVQRAAIALQEHDTAFERRNIDLADKPEWFLKLSPLGKVPLLLVNDDTVLFESSVIAEYIDDVSGGGLLATDPLEKSRQRAWIEFASGIIANIGQLYSAPDEAALDRARSGLEMKLRTLEANVSDGPWFSRSGFSLVDAAFAPALRYFDVIEPLTGDDFFARLPRVRRWRASLSARPSVQGAVGTDYKERLIAFMAKRDSVIGQMARPAIGAAA